MFSFFTDVAEIVVGVVVADLLVKHAPTITEKATNAYFAVQGKAAEYVASR